MDVRVGGSWRSSPRAVTDRTTCSRASISRSIRRSASCRRCEQRLDARPDVDRDDGVRGPDGKRTRFTQTSMFDTTEKRDDGPRCGRGRAPTITYQPARQGAGTTDRRQVMATTANGQQDQGSWLQRRRKGRGQGTRQGAQGRGEARRGQRRWRKGSAREDRRDARNPIESMAERIHEIVSTEAPQLDPKTWYGMPAYANERQAHLLLQAADKFKVALRDVRLRAGCADSTKARCGQSLTLSRS